MPVKWSIAQLLCACLLLLNVPVRVPAISAAAGPQGKTDSPDVYTRIILLEDERSLGDGELQALLQDKRTEVRCRAALAIGRIGDKRATPALLKALAEARTVKLRLITIFALGEMEDAQAVPALLNVLRQKTEAVDVRARAAEVLGKIASLQPNTALGPEMLEQIHQALITVLPAPELTLTPDNRLLTGLTITALMRVKLPSIVEPLTRQLKSRDAEIRAAAANALFRSAHPLQTAMPTLLELLADRDADVRANSARAIGLSKTANALDPLVKLLNDPSERVQVSAVRGLVALSDRRGIKPLLAFGQRLLEQYERGRKGGKAHPPQINLLLETVTALGSFKDQDSLPFLHRLRGATGIGAYPEIETALIGMGEKEFWTGLDDQTFVSVDWRKAANLIQPLGEIGSERAKAALLKICEQAEQGNLDARVMGALLNALNRAKLAIQPSLVRRQLDAKDPAMRALAARLLADLTEENFTVLARAFKRSEGGSMVAARLGLLAAIIRYKTPEAVSLVKAALSDLEQRVRRRAVELLGQVGVAGVEMPGSTVTTLHDRAYYARVRRLQNKKVTAIIYTSKGPIKVALFAADSPMTVDNFIALARQGYFKESLFHRIVPNFVAQGGGDPRAEGGPGYQIRCEINLRPYQRGSVGMALAGKDTGSSQFFFCHAPQPHLDGGYTVFGQVIAGMDVVDQLTRDDLIEKIEIRER
jgi:cyclophilin family peptidyl-prolyl cis-trans isomerase/HEAT repeat protein